MNIIIAALRTAFAALIFAASPVFAGMPEDLTKLQQGWEHIKYELPAAEQESRLERLVGEAGLLLDQNPNSAELMIWHAIIESTYAGAKGGLGALSSVKSAKKTLEQALAVNPDALDGSAYTSLGSLYYQVPGWPIGFGDSNKAEQLLQKALAINPNGIDPNFFYGEFMFRKGELDTAEKYLGKALAAAPRPGRKLADDGRRKEIQHLLDKVAAQRK